MPKQRPDRCCNPYENVGQKRHVGQNLRRISHEFLSKFPNISPNARLCSICRKRSRPTEETTTTEAKTGKQLSDSTVQKISECYTNDMNSRTMAGKKDTVSVKIDGEHTLIQKRTFFFQLVFRFDISDHGNPRIIVFRPFGQVFHF